MQGALMTCAALAALAQSIANAAAPRLPPGVVIAVIVTDETGAFVGVGSTCDKEYQDALVWYAAHYADRAHFSPLGAATIKEPHGPR